MSPKKTTSKQAKLVGMSIRPENSEKILLLHFSDHTFNSIPLRKGDSRLEVAAYFHQFADRIFDNTKEELNDEL